MVDFLGAFSLDEGVDEDAAGASQLLAATMRCGLATLVLAELTLPSVAKINGKTGDGASK